MDISLTLFLIETWTDERLNFTAKHPIHLSGLDGYRIWVPDLFFPFEVHAKPHDMTTPNMKLVLHQDGTVELTLRESLTFACPMDLSRFPMDEQSCNISMLSYRYCSKDLVLHITDEGFILPKSSDLSRFRIVGQETEMLDIGYGPAIHSGAQATIKLQRRLETYALTVYMPSFLLVIIAWLSFWIDPRSTPARVSLGVTVNLTLNTLSKGQTESMPGNSGVKALDIWLIVCQIFVFLAFVEYTVVNASMMNEYYRQLQYKKERRRQKSRKKSPDGEETTTEENSDSGVDYSLRLAYILDKISRYAFIILFMLFNAIYWFAYLY
ncbi:glycine receptor subunit alpha-2-like isoform X2 [Acanthaster planci]|nr:glycine receptor subunit alpha-2-like isoform X2 [Acanthaster planci]XP_022104604.1 glycine receptor subunit alpha-2-like isoform X2 [Acanthaster planci]